MKNMIMSEGGMIMINCVDVVECVVWFVDYGCVFGYEYVEVGYNFCMMSIVVVIGWV